MKPLQEGENTRGSQDHVQTKGTELFDGHIPFLLLEDLYKQPKSPRIDPDLAFPEPAERGRLTV